MSLIPHPAEMFGLDVGIDLSRGDLFMTKHFLNSDKGNSFDRFNVTNAFDLNADGIIDVLEINDRFAYSLDSMGNPTVINYGQGC